MHHQFSDGTYKTIDCEKPKGISDQAQLLRLINEYETQNYKILQYDYETISGRNQSISVLMVR
jgi:hypothetical protein